MVIHGVLLHRAYLVFHNNPIMLIRSFSVYHMRTLAPGEVKEIQPKATANALQTPDPGIIIGGTVPVLSASL